MEPYREADAKIEHLPKDIICRILSLLHMRDVARLSASCSAFVGAWGMYPRLTFEEDTLRLRRQAPTIGQHQQQDDIDLALQRRDELASCFVRHVDGVFSSRSRDSSDSRALDALIVKFAYLRERDAACVDRWVRLALASTTTRLLKLDFRPNGCYNPDKLQYDLPCSLLSAGTPAAVALEQLYLRQGSIRLQISPTCKPPGLTNLATLVLYKVRVTSQDLEQFLSSCHKLQSLKLKNCEDLEYLNVLHDRLKQLRLLVVKSCWSMRTIDVSGSAIESLRFDGRHLPASLLRGSTSGPALKTTSANFDLRFLIGTAKSEAATDSSRLELLSLARLMPGLETLSLNLERDVKVFMTSPHSSDNRFRHLKRVDLGVYMPGRYGRDDFLFLYPFLDASPALEVLSLDLFRCQPTFDARRPRIIQPGEGGYFRKHLGLTHYSLKVVDIIGFDADLASLELVLFILDKARVLQRISLEQTWKINYEEDFINKANARKIRLIHKAILRYIAPAVPLGSSILLQVK